MMVQYCCDSGSTNKLFCKCFLVAVIALVVVVILATAVVAVVIASVGHSFTSFLKANWPITLHSQNVCCTKYKC